jgi:glycosyltransferase involved in cell wall biosynthesis
MNEHRDITVVISTYNRSESLPSAIESVLNQEANGTAYELIVVDNNSTDNTSQVVQSYIDRGHDNLRCLSEPRQGLSYGRNAGIANAQGEIIVFTDDDIRAERNWVANIKRAFDTYPDVQCVAGKILPSWASEPPSWLTSDHWTPLALQDHGDVPLRANKIKPRSFAGANIAFRREVFRNELFSPLFPRAQDTEFLLRFWRAGLEAMYVPDVIVFADVQPERLTKVYHRKWHTRNGNFNALMRLGEYVGADGRVLDEMPAAETLFEVPVYIYRQLLDACGEWVVATVRRSESVSFKHENRIRFLLGYISHRYHNEFASQDRSRPREVGRAFNAMLRKVTSRAGKRDRS